MTDLMSQNATSSWGGTRKLPFVFTEHGVPMLSSVLNSQRATQVNIQIMRIYTRLREMLLSNIDLGLKIEKLDKKIVNLGYDVKMHDGEIESIFELLNEMKEVSIKPKPRNPIGFKIKSTTKVQNKASKNVIAKSVTKRQSEK